MEEKVEAYIESLIQGCLKSTHFSGLPEDQKKESEAKIRNYFQTLIFDTLIDNLTDEQIESIKDLDLKSQESEEKLALLAASVPGFAFILDEKLKQAAETISQSGQIPQ